MSDPAENLEQSWLRAYLDHYVDITFMVSASSQMASHGVHLSDVQHVLRTGTIVYSERGYDGSVVMITGRNCDEVELEIEVWVVSDKMSVTVQKVRKVKQERKAS